MFLLPELKTERYHKAENRGKKKKGRDDIALPHKVLV